MRALRMVAYATFIVAGLYASNAAAQSLGASKSSVSHAYPEAVSTSIDEMAALELRDVDFAGVRWGKVDYVFNAAGRLDHLSMTTQSADYDAVLKLATIQMNPPRHDSGATAIDGQGPSDLEIRVCEAGGLVTMTFERLSSAT